MIWAAALRVHPLLEIVCITDAVSAGQESMIRDHHASGEAMGRAYPQFPIPAVGAVVVKDSDVLLIVRGKDPGYGQWSIPGGAILLGETLEEAVTREIKEEVGILAEPVGLVEVLDRIVHDESGRILYHYVLLDYLCLYHSGNLRVGSDAVKAQWVKGSDIRRYDLPKQTEEVVRKGLKMARSQSKNQNDK